MVEIVSQIKTAEAEADQIKKSARTQARQIRDDAVTAGKKLVEEESQKASAKASGMLADAQSKAQAYLDEHAAQSTVQCEALGVQAQENLAAAAARIVERIVESL